MIRLRNRLHIEINFFGVCKANLHSWEESGHQLRISHPIQQIMKLGFQRYSTKLHQKQFNLWQGTGHGLIHYKSKRAHRLIILRNVFLMFHLRNLQKFLLNTITLHFLAIHFLRNQVGALFGWGLQCLCVEDANGDNTHSVQHAELLFQLRSVLVLMLTNHFIGVLQGWYVWTNVGILEIVSLQVRQSEFLFEFAKKGECFGKINWSSGI